MLILFCDDEKTASSMQQIKVNVMDKVPEPLTKEEQKQAQEAAEKDRAAANKAKEEAQKAGKKFVPPQPTPAPQPKTHPPLVRVGTKERFLADFAYLAVVLTTEDKRNIAQAGKDKSADSSLSDNCKLALEYKVTTFPQMVFCDCYGNLLGSKPVPNAKQMADMIVKSRTEMLKEQMALEDSLEKQYEKAAKAFEDGKTKQVFTPSTITQLQKIAAYKGENTSYDAVMQARNCLKEIPNLPEGGKPDKVIETSGAHK
ncbi:MAG: hypothetical protein V1701_09240 [Planctomycetota bacterium]